MTPKEKAEELVNKFRIVSYGKYSLPTKNNAKKCALIAVNEILEEHRFDDSDYANRKFKFWQEVKQEIEKL